jgi:hypothetical protein
MRRFHMKQVEILELAMEALILRKREPGATKEDIAAIDEKLKTLSYMFAVEAQKERK